MTALTLNLEPVIHLTDKQFYQLCQINRDIRFERTAKGELIVMPPTGWGTGNRNSELTFQLQAWSRQNRLGKAFDSSTGFTLPNGADRSPFGRGLDPELDPKGSRQRPDTAWVQQERFDTLNPDPDKFLPLAPDFVVKLRSASDHLKPLQQKMQEYMENGVRLGWLINSKEMPPARWREQQVEIYRLGQAVAVLKSPTTLSGEDVLPGFMLDLSGIL